MSDIIEVIKDVTTVTIASDGPQGPTGPTGATGATGSSGVISVVAPITNTGTSTSAIIGINAGVANGVATLDSGGKVPQSQIPAVAITNTFVVASQAAMLALTAEEGDVAVRTDQNKTYILTATPSSTLANWQELLTPTDTVTSVDGRIGTVTLTDKYAQLATANTFTGGVQQITTASAATEGLIVRGIASQTADLQQWKNNAGTIIASIDSVGRSSAVATVINGFAKGLAYLGIQTTAADKGLIIRGAASQTANLQEWQDSASVVRASISPTGSIATRPVAFAANLNVAIISATDTSATWSAGNFAFRSDSGGIPRFSFTAPNAATELLTLNGNAVGILTTSPSAFFQVTSNNAATIGAIIKGQVSQTADLQQWQNSAGTVLAKIDSAGSLTFTQAGANITTPASGRLNIGGAVYGTSAFGTISVFGDTGGYALDARGSTTSGSIGVRFRSGNAANVTVVVQAESAQTADLQRWGNSSGTVLTAITNAGTINFNTGNTSATATTGAVALPALAVGFITMQVAGTTVKVPYYAN